MLISLLTGAAIHPVYVSVTSIEYNEKQQMLEVSCKLFVDDMEKFLRTRHGGKVDLLHPDREGRTDSLLARYLTDHLMLQVNGSKAPLDYVGFEQEGDAIIVYLEADGITAVRELLVRDNILYDYKAQQVSVINVKVGKNKQGRRLVNPEEEALFLF